MVNEYSRLKWNESKASSKFVCWIQRFFSFKISFVSPTFFSKQSKPTKGRRRELTDEENEEIKEAFALFDNDKDNEVDYHEFKVCRYFFSMCWTQSID